ncbi:MAG: type IV secretion system DNA-binding domain-containing protein [Eubacteriales bacterium]|nr:type IV secretion system DNA-binding domain-containing protein [Eubacteriales bacterium]
MGSDLIYEMKLPKRKESHAWPSGKAYITVTNEEGTELRLPVLKSASMLLTGVVETGKSTLCKAYVKAYEEGYSGEDPDYRGVFFEIKPDDYMAAFFEKGDKVIAYDLGSFGDAAFKWCMIRELRQARNIDAEIETLSREFFKDLIEKASHNLVWANAAKQTFKAFLSSVIYRYRDCPSNRLLIKRLRIMTHIELMRFLAQYEPNLPFLKNTFDYDPKDDSKFVMPKKGLDTMFFFDYVLQRFSGCLVEDGGDTIHDFLHGKYGKHLFIVHDFAMADSMSMIERYFLKKMIDEKLSCSSDLYGKPLLLVLDEVDKVGYDFGLNDAVTLGRQGGLTILLSTQSIENLYKIAPEKNAEHITNGSLSGFQVVVSFRAGDPVTVEKLQTLFGTTDRVKITLGLSRLDSSQTVIVTEPKVTTEMLQQLGVGEFYVKIKEGDPVKFKILLNNQGGILI